MSAFELSVEAIEGVLDSRAPLLPELVLALGQPGGLASCPLAQQALTETADCLNGLEEMPSLSYSLYRALAIHGNRAPYETPYWLRRQRVTALVLRVLMGDKSLIEPLQDYLWAICEESTWTEPWHEGRIICLSAATTAVTLAETLVFVGENLTAEIRHRVRHELDRRIFTPYLTRGYDLDRSWGAMNWNSVCNSGIAMAFLAAEFDQGRVADAVHRALQGIRRYLEEGFAEDGSTSEGVGYWHYGMSSLVIFAETLRSRTSGAIDLLDSPRIRQVAAFPAKMRLVGRTFATFSDSPESPAFLSGIVARLAERTGEVSLYGLLDEGALLSGYDVPRLLRDMLWRRPAQRMPMLEDVVLPSGGLVRLVARGDDGRACVLMAKAGHNDEHHNHNDVGSFIFHIDGEDLLVDPGPGAYTRDYFNFGERRYENPFANSYGHSVPRIDGMGQGTGLEYRGEIVAVDSITMPKSVTLDLRRSYPSECGLVRFLRELTLHDGSSLTLHDSFEFSRCPSLLEEVLMTWGDVEIEGASARVYGERHSLQLQIEEPSNASFGLELMSEASMANGRAQVLKRITVVMMGSSSRSFRVRVEVV